VIYVYVAQEEVSTIDSKIEYNENLIHSIEKQDPSENGQKEVTTLRMKSR